MYLYTYIEIILNISREKEQLLLIYVEQLIEEHGPVVQKNIQQFHQENNWYVQVVRNGLLYSLLFVTD